MIYVASDIMLIQGVLSFLLEDSRLRSQFLILYIPSVIILQFQTVYGIHRQHRPVDLQFLHCPDPKSVSQHSQQKQRSTNLSR
jgi:hypothetical protein